QQLPEFWNYFPPPASVMTLPIGQSPLGTVLALHAAEQQLVIKIKVPLGLPDPTPLIPDANPPTSARWQLGKQLFFDERWLTAGGGVACAPCHKPAAGFSEPAAPLRAPRMNAPGLINSVYNRHQFWDGRATSLEEVLQRRAEEPPAPGDQPTTSPNLRHTWDG